MTRFQRAVLLGGLTCAALELLRGALRLELGWGPPMLLAHWIVYAVVGRYAADARRPRASAAAGALVGAVTLVLRLAQPYRVVLVVVWPVLLLVLLAGTVAMGALLGWLGGRVGRGTARPPIS